MSFPAQVARVRDSNRPIWYRLVALRECISLLSYCSEQGYRELLQQFDKEFHFNRNYPRIDPPTELEILTTLDAVIKERARCLEKLQAQQQTKHHQKLARKNAQRLASVRRFQGQDSGV
jgi:hypothetical protein